MMELEFTIEEFSDEVLEVLQLVSPLELTAGPDRREPFLLSRLISSVVGVQRMSNRIMFGRSFGIGPVRRELNHLCGWWPLVNFLLMLKGNVG